MKIMFDHSIFEKQKFGGISRYFVNLLNSLRINKDLQPKIFCQIYKNFYLKNVSKSHKKGFYFNREIPFTGNIIKLINNLSFRYNYNKFKPDIYHQTYYENKKFKISCPKFITVYDLYHEIYHKNKNYRPKKALENVDHIFTISNNTKNDLINLYSIDPNNITVSHLGHDHVQLNLDNNIKFDPFLLFVGSRKQYKNFYFFLKSISLSKKILKDFNIIFFGGGNFNNEELKYISELKISPGKIKNIQGSDEDLYSLYNSAAAFIFPSSHEGFGLPIIESMKAECPVVCSDIPVFREIADGAAEFFNLNDNNNLVDAIENVIFSDAKQKRLIDSGKKRIENFSWDKCADRTLSAYKKFI